MDNNNWSSTLVKNYDEKKTYYLVKLSESFSNTIQEYSAAQQKKAKSSNHNHHNNNSSDYDQLNKYYQYSLEALSIPLVNANVAAKNGTSNNVTREVPTIQFHGSYGAIKFPNGKCYDFSLEKSANTVECIRQTKNKWETVGKTTRCLHVKGKDDVYQRTRTKMEAAEQEKRKNCTKLIEENKKGASGTKNPSSLIVTPAISNHNKIHKTNSSYKSHRSTFNLATNTSSTNNYSNNNNVSASGNLHHNLDLSEYPEITNVEQLKKYKAEFDKDYQDYQHLHGYLHTIEERFSKLRETLKQSAEGSQGWESARKQIISEYERTKSDSNFHKARSKYKQLYSKLTHIKDRIFKFKHQNRDKINHNKPIHMNKRRKR